MLRAGGQKLGTLGCWLETVKDNPSFTIRTPALGHSELQRDPEIQGEGGGELEASGDTIP